MPAYYMINCAHPTHFDATLAGKAAWLDRIRGIRANASKRSHAELNEAPDLDDGDPVELGGQYRALVRRHPQIGVLGGCCGTDHRHIAADLRRMQAAGRCVRKPGERVHCPEQAGTGFPSRLRRWDSPPPCGEGLGVGGTPTSEVWDSPHPVPPPQGGRGRCGALRAQLERRVLFAGTAPAIGSLQPGGCLSLQRLCRRDFCEALSRLLHEANPLIALREGVRNLWQRAEDLDTPRPGFALA